MARMVQDFSLRYPLIHGQGNWGSIEGDNQAAMRYTECKMSKIAEEMLIDIEKETVDWQPNYDSSRLEPKVLPAKLPMLLLNGAVGIAVGMATNIPPHNLSEVVDAAICYINDPKVTGEDLMEYIKGPDFPTGGIIYDKKAIKAAYMAGRGGITCRAVTDIADDQIVITEVPYQVNISDLLIKIAGLVTEKRIEGIRDIRNESDKDGLRIVIELKKDAVGQKVLNQLYKFTDLQKDFHLNILALENGIKPQIMSVLDIIRYFVEHRKEVVRRRAEFDLKKAKEREHILLGLKKALDDIDAVISTIKKSKNRDEAKDNLIKKFKFTEIQANAILEMRLQTLAALETHRIEEELKEKQLLIKELQLLLSDVKRMMKVIKEELEDIKARYGDERRTKVVATGLKTLSDEDLIPAEDTIISLSHGGSIKRQPPDSVRSQHRGGKGLIGSDVADEDFISHFVNANTHDNILFFTNRGRVFQTKVWEIPLASRTAKGKAIQNFLEIPGDESVSAIIAYEKNKEGYLVMITKHGVIKKTSLADFGNVRKNGIIAITLKEKDELQWVGLSSGEDQVILTTLEGMSIRFKESDVRAMGRGASGVTAIRLKGKDEVTSVNIISKELAKTAKLLVVMDKGYGKQTTISEYKTQQRGGSGVKTAKIGEKTGKLISAHIIIDDTDLFVLSAKGQMIRTTLDSVRSASRDTQGVKLMSLSAGDKIIGSICL